MADTSEIGTYRRLFAQKYREIEELLFKLPAEALLWKPFEQSPWRGPAGSLGWLIAHAVSSTVYLLRRAEWQMGKIPWTAVDGDEGSEEFGPANHDPDYLRQRAGRTHEYVEEFLRQLDAQALDDGQAHPINDHPLTVRYDVQHAIEHMAQHIGHAQLTRQLWAIASNE
ncbi:MAG: DinB family protein [Caldilineaceae bacterium]|nr:DinB family protein [Caldilineaceae bacterium]